MRPRQSSILAQRCRCAPATSLGTAGQAFCPQYRGVAADRVYMNGHSRAVPWALTPRFHPCCPNGRRYLSVALFLKSPSAAVSRYPCPAQPGLSSHPRFRSGCATALFAHGGILLYLWKSVKVILPTAERRMALHLPRRWAIIKSSDPETK